MDAPNGTGSPFTAPVTGSDWAGGGAAVAPSEWASDDSYHPAITAIDVTAMALAPDGDLVAGGLFYENGTFDAYNLVRLHPDGTEDTGFAHFHAAKPYALTVQPSGDVLVAADVSSATPNRVRGVVRLDESGALDSTFADLAADATVQTVQQLDDGRLVVGGYFSVIGGVSRHGVAVLTADGVVDPSFADPGIIGGVTSLSVEADGSIVAVGPFTEAGGVAQAGIVRIDDEGARLPNLVAPSLGGMAPRFERVAVLPDGRLALGGRFTAVNGIPRTGFVVLDATGQVDESVADLELPADRGIRALHVDREGRLVVAGWFSTIRGEERSAIVRLLPDGSLDPTFVDPQLDVVKAVVEEASGDLVVGGVFSTVEGRPTPRLARLLADGTPRPGSLDGTFGEGGLVLAAVDPPEFAFDVAVQTDGGIVTAGTVSGRGGRISVMRFDDTGKSDPTFGGDGAVQTNITPGDDWAHAIAVQADGRLVVAGHAGGSSGPMAVLRYLPDGRLDRSFSGDGKLTIDFGYGAEVAYDVVVLPSGKIVVAGAIDGRGGRIGLARLRTDGSLDPGFGSGGKVATNITEHQDFAWSLVAAPGGRVVAAGVADTGLNGSPVAVAVRYLKDGRLDTTFDGDGKRTWRFSSGALGAATAATFDTSGRLLVAGFDSRGGGRMAVVRLRADGSTEVGAFADFGSLEDSPWDLLVDGTGRVVVAGYGEGGQVAVARLGPDLALDTSFNDDGWVATDVTVGGTDVAFGAAFDSAGRIVLAGGAGVSVPEVLVARYVSN